MKNILSILLIVFSTSVFAQKGFYIKPVIGAGITDVDYWREYRNINKLDDVNGLTYKVMVMGGYQFKKLRLEFGLGYLSVRNGYDHAPFSYIDNFGIPASTVYADVRYTSSYLAIPVQVAYAFNINDKFDLQPQLGLSLNYNLNTKASGSEYDLAGKKLKEYPTMNFKYKTTELAGNAGIMLNYKLTNKLTLFAGPALTYFIANIENMRVYKATTYCVMIDAGITMKL